VPDLDVAFKLFLGKDGFIIYPTAMSMCVSCWQGIDSSANRVPLGTTKSNASSWCCPILWWRFAISITVFIGSTNNFRLSCRYIVGTSTPLLVIFHYTPQKNCWNHHFSAGQISQVPFFTMIRTKQQSTYRVKVRIRDAARRPFFVSLKGKIAGVKAVTLATDSVND